MSGWTNRGESWMHRESTIPSHASIAGGNTGGLRFEACVEHHGREAHQSGIVVNTLPVLDPRLDRPDRSRPGRGCRWPVRLDRLLAAVVCGAKGRVAGDRCQWMPSRRPSAAGARTPEPK
jgi:hypothetical protein